MADLNDGESVEMKGSGAKPYVLKNVGGVYSCTCPAWRNQSIAIERRTCKHLRKLRGDAAEEARIGPGVPPGPEADEEEGDGRREDGPAPAPGRALGQRPGPRRLVAEREARRRPRLLGRQVADLPAGQPLPRPRLVPRGLARDPARRRAVDRPQGLPAHRRHRPPAGQDRPLEGGPLRRVRRPGCRRRVRGSPRGHPRARRSPPAAVPGGPRARGLHRPGPPPRGAGAHRGARRRRADAPPAANRATRSAGR